MPEQTIQPAAAAGLDTYINEELPTTNYATNTLLVVGSKATSLNQDALLKFDLSPIAAGSIIQEATLSLYLDGYFANPASATISRIKSGNSAWAEASVTWNTVDGSAAWAGSVGCETSGTDYDPDALWTGTPHHTTGTWQDCSLNIGVFQKMIDVGNYGMKFWLDQRGATGTEYLNYRSSDHATASTRPKLYVRWLEPTGRLVEYTFDIWNPETILLDSKGAVVKPNEVRPDRWIRVLFDLPRGKSYASLIEDPTASYIVGVSFSESGVTIKTDRNQFSEIIVQRLAGGSG